MTTHATRQWGQSEPPRVSTCKGCGARIIWMISDLTGKAAPINATPNPKGNIVFVQGEKRLEYHVLRSGEVVPEGRSAYTNHFQTCPQRARFERKGGGERT